MSKKTPMMQQYDEAKEACGDALLLFRMGDFYELFHEDAKTGARVLGLTLTAREKEENPIPMAGFPHHQLDSYLAKLIAAGHRAAVCEQVEDPKLAKGLVKREVTRVVTPGTLTDDALLDPQKANFLAAIAWPAKKEKRKNKADWVGIAWADLSTGRFVAGTFPPNEIENQIARVDPSEILVSEEEAASIEAGRNIVRRPSWAFSRDGAEKALANHLGTKSLAGFGFDDEDSPAVRAAGAILDYLIETQKASLDHIDQIDKYQVGNSLEIDDATRRSLEITQTMRDGKRHGSLLAVMDRTVTAMGARLLYDWVASPLTSIELINSRLDAVDELVGNIELRLEMRQQLCGVYDVERLLARVITGRASPRDIQFIGATLRLLPPLKELLHRVEAGWFSKIAETFETNAELQNEISAALADECPLHARDGGFVRAGFDDELDRLRQLATGGKQWIAEYQASESERTGIQNLKVGYNKVFGYYLEVSAANQSKVPDSYIRKQTLKNAERYITPELKEYEEKVLSADDKAKELEYEIFVNLRERVRAHGRSLQQAAYVLAQLDAINSLAELAHERNYVRPQLVDEPVLEIVDGRHPVLDIIEPDGTFVPNDTESKPDESLILLITGPNMAGKSTYIRQVALINLMAQVGSFVPARRATIGLTDRIFARVGAADELSRGQSTFMVEMTETARILNSATDRSLVILDEVGRGTSTYDGVSLAWAIVEHLHEQTQCRTLFATHYHELTDLAGTLDSVRNLNVDVKEWDDNVIFLHKIVPGAADKSYGIHVARLAGVPKSVNERAKEILAHLESEHIDQTSKISASNKKKERRGDIQLTLFGFADHPIIDKIRDLQVDHLTPIEALQQLQSFKEELLTDEPAKKPK